MWANRYVSRVIGSAKYDPVKPALALLVTPSVVRLTTSALLVETKVLPYPAVPVSFARRGDDVDEGDTNRRDGSQGHASQSSGEGTDAFHRRRELAFFGRVRQLATPMLQRRSASQRPQAECGKKTFGAARVENII